MFSTWKYTPVKNLSTPTLALPAIQDHVDLFSEKKHSHRHIHDIFTELQQHDFSTYDTTRNIPSIDGTTKLSVYLRF